MSNSHLLVIKKWRLNRFLVVTCVKIIDSIIILIVKNVFIIILCLMSGFVYSQTVDYFAVKNVISKTFPEIDFNNKLLAISVWNSSDIVSRELNKEFYKTWFTYQEAKLKGGLKGVIFISISSDEDELSFRISDKKDAISHSYTICDFQSYKAKGKLATMKLDNSIKNMVFDFNGNLIFQNLEISAVFKSFNNLITR